MPLDDRFPNGWRRRRRGGAVLLLEKIVARIVLLVLALLCGEQIEELSVKKEDENQVAQTTK